MRSTLVTSTLCGLVAAAPQVINISAFKNLPTPSILGPEPGATTTPTISYNPTSAAASVAAAIQTNPIQAKRSESKRDQTCAPQPEGAGPIPGEGSVADYLEANNILANNATNAITPSGYIRSFVNAQGSVQQSGYMTYRTVDSGNYDVKSCADFCDSEKFCMGFNIYYERDPAVDPNAQSCANPPPVTNVKCSFYGYPIAATSATNQGQWRGYQDSKGEAFHVVIAGSNGYSKLDPCREPGPQTNFTGPVALNAAINAPLDGNVDTYIGMKLFNDGPFDVSLCAAACQAQTAYDRSTAASDGTYKPCNFFNAYILLKNDFPQGTYCSFYTRSWGTEYAVNTGYDDGSDQYRVVGSFSYTLTNTDSGKI